MKKAGFLVPGAQVLIWNNTHKKGNVLLSLALVYLKSKTGKGFAASICAAKAIKVASAAGRPII